MNVMSMPLAMSNFCCLMMDGNIAPSVRGLNTTIVTGAGSAARADDPSSIVNTAIAGTSSFMFAPAARPACRHPGALPCDRRGMVLNSPSSFKMRIRNAPNRLIAETGRAPLSCGSGRRIVVKRACTPI
jgi:hypothetical protein